MRGALAAVAVVGFIGTAVIAPFTASRPALADEGFYERINQMYIPGETGNLVLGPGADGPIYQSLETADDSVRGGGASLSAIEQLNAQNAASAEEIPKPKPEPVAAPERAAGAAAAAAPLLYTGGGSPAEWMAAAGIAEGDWGYVDYIATRESGWNPNATNASSGACGVIQALPCSKVPGSGYDPVDNLRWANGYAVGRYGSWAQAYAFWTSNHWW